MSRSKIRTYWLITGIIVRAYGTAGLLALMLGAMSLLLSMATDDANDVAGRPVASIVASRTAALP
jgi:hypothetical protein